MKFCFGDIIRRFKNARRKKPKIINMDKSPKCKKCQCGVCKFDYGKSICMMSSGCHVRCESCDRGSNYIKATKPDCIEFITEE